MISEMEYERDLQESLCVLLEQIDEADEQRRIQLKIDLKALMNRWITQHETVCHLLILKLMELEQAPKIMKVRIKD